MNVSKPETNGGENCSQALTTEQVCAILRINRKTLYKMIARGEISGAKSGKGYKVSPDTVAEFLKGKGREQK